MNDGKAQGQDQLDRLLADYFRPETSPADMGRKLAAAARESETALTRLEGKLGIEATPRGISLVRTGPAGKPATAAARKLIEQAREEIHEYLRGQRAFFRVPVDLAAVPDFQRKVLRGRAAHPVRRGATVRVDRGAHRQSPRGARGGDRARPQSGAAHPALPPRVAERRRPRRLHLRRGGEGRAGRARADHAGAGGLHEHAHRVPRGLHPRPAHAPGQPRGVRLGGRRALGGVPAVQALPPRSVKSARSPSQHRLRAGGLGGCGPGPG